MTKLDKNIDIRVISDKDTLKNIIMLLAHIRYIIKSKKPTTIEINMNQHKTTDLYFSVNNQEVSNYIPKKTITIN
jgi:hypothetical protein